MTPMDKELVEEVEMKERKIREAKQRVVEGIKRVWEEGKTARVVFALRHSPVLQLYYYLASVEEEDVEVKPQFTYKYRVIWLDSMHARDVFECVFVLPPPTEDPAAVEKLPEILPSDYPLDFSIPAKVMELFERLYGTYSTPAHRLTVQSRSRGGDYPDDEIEINIIYNEYNPPDDC